MESDQYIYVRNSVKEILGIDISHYKDKQMRRRLDAWLSRSKQTTWNEYFSVIGSEKDERTRFRNYITINVSEFFRDIDRWKTLEENVLPLLLRKNNSSLTNRINVWSAGCSIGAEAYSLAILLDEMSPGHSHYILASDLDQNALSIARGGGPYIENDIKCVSPERRLKYFEYREDKPYLCKKINNKVKFIEQNILTDPFEQGFDLIVCRNVVIYFTNEAKDLLFKKFHAALRPGGILFLGGTEIMSHPREIGFENFEISFYKKK